MTSYTTWLNLPKPDGIDNVAAVNTAMDMIDTEIASRRAAITASSGKWPKKGIVWNTDEARNYATSLTLSDVFQISNLVVGAKYVMFANLLLKGTGTDPRFNWGFNKVGVKAYLGVFGPRELMDASTQFGLFTTATASRVSSSNEWILNNSEYIHVGSAGGFTKVLFTALLDVTAPGAFFKLAWSCMPNPGDRVDIKAGSSVEYRRVA